MQLLGCRTTYKMSWGVGYRWQLTDVMQLYNYKVDGQKRNANRTILDEVQPSLIWMRALLLSLLTTL